MKDATVLAPLARYRSSLKLACGEASELRLFELLKVVFQCEIRNIEFIHHISRGTTIVIVPFETLINRLTPAGLIYSTPLICFPFACFAKFGDVIFTFNDLCLTIWSQS